MGGDLLQLLFLSSSCHTFKQKNGDRPPTEGTTTGLLPIEPLDVWARIHRCQLQARMTTIMPPSLEENAISRLNAFTAREKHIQQILAVTFASMSILSALLTMYWFVRLKRVYRHQLILLLVASGLFKAIWFFIPPMLVLIRHRPMSPPFCQGIGFLLAVGIEASGLSPLTL